MCASNDDVHLLEIEVSDLVDAVTPLSVGGNLLDDEGDTQNATLLEKGSLPASATAGFDNLSGPKNINNDDLFNVEGL